MSLQLSAVLGLYSLQLGEEGGEGWGVGDRWVGGVVLSLWDSLSETVSLNFSKRYPALKIS